MSVVIDADLLVVLALDDDRAPLVETQLRQWRAAGEALHAPALMPYEAANALARAVATRTLDAAAIAEAWAVVAGVPVQLHALDAGTRVIDMAQQLGRQSAYDAGYIVLAQMLGAALWTLDGPLARNATGLQVPVHLLS